MRRMSRAHLAAAPSVGAFRGASTSALPPRPPADQPAGRTRWSTSFGTTRPFPDWTCCPRCHGCRQSCPTAAGMEGCRAESRSRAGQCPRPRPVARAEAALRPFPNRENLHLIKNEPFKFKDILSTNSILPIKSLE